MKEKIKELKAKYDALPKDKKIVILVAIVVVVLVVANLLSSVVG